MKNLDFRVSLKIQQPWFTLLPVNCRELPFVDRGLSSFSPVGLKHHLASKSQPASRISMTCLGACP